MLPVSMAVHLFISSVAAISFCTARRKCEVIDVRVGIVRILNFAAHIVYDEMETILTVSTY